MRTLGDHFASERIDFRQAINLITEHLDADDLLRLADRKHFNRITAHAKRAADQIHIIACVLNIHQLAQNFLLRLHLTFTQGHHHLRIILRIAQAVNAGNRRDNNHVTALE